MSEVLVAVKHPETRWVNKELGADITGRQTVTVEETETVRRAIIGGLLVRVKDAANYPQYPNEKVAKPKAEAEAGTDSKKKDKDSAKKSGEQ